MKYFLLSGLLVLAFALTACESNDDINAPGDTTSLLKAVESLDLTDAQLAQIDEMFWLEEDMSCVLNPSQTRALNTIVTGMSPEFNGRRDPRGIGIDIAALVHLRLILKAVPDLPEATKQEMIDLIKASNAKRLDLIQTYKDNPAELRAQLKAEHDALIIAMNALLTESQLAAVETLKEKIRQMREELRETWAQLRIEQLLIRMKHHLALDEDQAAAVKALLQAQHEAIKQLRIDYEGDPEGFREALKDLLAQFDLDMKEILNDEQDAKWDVLKGKLRDWRRGHGGFRG
jgi:hypothetical protein